MKILKWPSFHTGNFKIFKNALGQFISNRPPKNVIINIENTLLLSKHYIGKKCFEYFIGYVNHSNDDKKPLLISLHKLNRFIKSFEKVECMSVLLEEKHEDILNKYIERRNRITDLFGKDFDVEVILTAKYISTKMMPFEDEIRTDTHDDGLPLEKTPCATHSIILDD